MDKWDWRSSANLRKALFFWISGFWSNSVPFAMFFCYRCPSWVCGPKLSSWRCGL